MPSQITRFKCDFCKKHYSTKYDAVKHERQCLYNPVNKSCSTCNNRTSNWCDRLFKDIFIDGQPIRNCEGWEEIKPFEDEEYE